MWAGYTGVSSVLALTALVITMRMDHRDKRELSLAKTMPTLAVIAKQNHFIKEVSNALKEPYSSVMLRQQ